MVYGTRYPDRSQVDPFWILTLWRTPHAVTGKRPSTFDIARVLGIDEAIVANVLAEARDAEHKRRQEQEQEWRNAAHADPAHDEAQDPREPGAGHAPDETLEPGVHSLGDHGAEAPPADAQGSDPRPGDHADPLVVGAPQGGADDPAGIPLPRGAMGASSALHPDSLKIKSLLADAMTECVAGLGERKAEILTRRMKALREDVINDFFIGIEDAPWFVRGPDNAKIGLVLWYAVEQLLQDGTLELYEGSAMADALMMLPPMIDHVARIEGVDRSARKQAPKFIKRLQQAGYFKG